MSHVYQHHSKVHSWSNHITSSQQMYHQIKQQANINRTCQQWVNSAIEHHVLDVIPDPGEATECRRRTSSSCAGGSWLPGATADDRGAVRALRWLVVIPCAERGQVSVVGRRNCEERTQALVPQVVRCALFYKKNVRWTWRRNSPTETERVHRAYLHLQAKIPHQS